MHILYIASVVRSICRQNIPLWMIQKTPQLKINCARLMSGFQEHITQMLVVFIFGCLIPATIRVIQQFKHQLIAAVLAILGLRLALGAYVVTMTKGLERASEALLE